MSFLSRRAQAPENSICLLVLAMALTTVVLITFDFSRVQAQEQKREIISDAFTRNRKSRVQEPLTNKRSQGQSSRAQAKAKSNRVYRLASPAMASLPLTSQRSSLAQLGITTWRLRPATVNDTGAESIIGEKNKTAEWIPERVRADTKFRDGDLVRLSIESPRTGYLYVVNRDLLADGTTGEAILIYPWPNMRVDENLMRPGRIVDIPAQEDTPSYFTARPTRPDQVGEMLTFIVTKSPLNLRLSEQPFRIAKAQLMLWEKMWNAQSERFEMEGGVGESWTRQERQAALRLRARQLTRDDPAPQTIYRVSASNRFAFMVNLQLKYQ